MDPLIDEAPLTPMIRYFHEDPAEAFRITKPSYTVPDPNFPMEKCCRILCQRLGIPPLASYLFSCCEFRIDNSNIRRWMAPGDPLPKSVELRLVTHQFSPQQLGYLSDRALHYHFLCVKHDLISGRIKIDNPDQRQRAKIIQKLLNLDLCRALCQRGNYGSVCDVNFQWERDLVESMVKLYRTLLAPKILRANIIDSILRNVLWRRAPKSLHEKYLPQLIDRIQGKHWTDFAVAYLDLIQESCPGIKSNQYTVKINNCPRMIRLGPEGIGKMCDIGSLHEARFTNPKCIEISMIGDDKFELAFEKQIDATSFAVELSCYYRIVHFSSRLFDDTIPGLVCPSLIFQHAHNCWGPLNEIHDKRAAFEASTMRSEYQFNAIAFESAEFYDVVGLLVKHRQLESLRWYNLHWRGGNSYEFEDAERRIAYQSLDAAAAGQLRELDPEAAQNPEADQERMLMHFEASSPLPPILSITSDNLMNNKPQPRIIRTHESMIRGHYNVLELARMDSKVIALKYIQQRWKNDRSTLDAFNKSQEFMTQLRNHLDRERDAPLVFRRLLFSIDQNQLLYPKCVVLEYLKDPITEILRTDGQRYSLYHLLQACMDLVDAVEFMHLFDMVHGEISCRKIFVRQNPAKNGTGDFHVKLIEPCFHNQSMVRSKKQDMNDLGLTMQQIFMDACQPGSRTGQMVVNFRLFDSKNRYRPYLPQQLFSAVTDQLQRMLLLLLGNEFNRPNAAELKSEMSKWIDQIILIKLTDQSCRIDYDEIMGPQRLYCCDASDLLPMTKNQSTGQSTVSSTGCPSGGQSGQGKSSPSDQAFNAYAAQAPSVESWLQRDPEGAIIGQGSFGVVLKVIHKSSKKIFALKKLKPQRDGLGRLINMKELTADLRSEMDASLNLNHPNVVSLCGIQYDQHGLITGILMSYELNGSMVQYLRDHKPISNDQIDDLDEPTTISEQQKLKWAYQIALGMCYLHDRGIVHRDLAGRNVLLSEDLMAKISDFGLSVFGISKPLERVPNIGWPPEWHALDDHQHEAGASQRLAVYQKSGDVWSYGVTLWEIDNDGAKPIRPSQSNSAGSARLRFLITECMKPVANERPTFENLVRYNFDVANAFVA